MDTQAIVKLVLSKLGTNNQLISGFLADPIKTITKTLGIEVSQEQLNTVIQLVTEKLKGEGLEAVVGQAASALGGKDAGSVLSALGNLIK